MLRPMMLTVALVACAGEKEEEMAAMMEGTIVPDHPEVSTSAEFTSYKAFGFDNNGKFIAYISSNPEAHCGDVVNYLNIGGDPYDPAEVLAPGKCNIMIKLAEGYEDGIELSDDPISAAATSIECAMGTGEFRLETRGEGQSQSRDYFWSGDDSHWWQGAPQLYDWSFTGNFDQGYQLDITMNTYKGTFIHEEFTKYDADGLVQGSVQAYSCEGLASTGLF